MTPYGHDVLRRYDHGIGRHRHDRVEIACGQRVGEVAEVICQKGVDQGELRPQCGLEQKRRSVYLDLALAFGHRGADAGWREHASETATARANAFDEGPLGYEIDGDLIGQHLLLCLRIEADVACGEARDECRIEQLANAFPRDRSVVADQRKTALLLPDDFVKQALRRSDTHESADHDARPGRDHCNGFFDGNGPHD